MDNIYTQITKLYSNKTFLGRYSLDLWITIILFLCVFLMLSYFHVLNNIQPIKKDWNNQKCNPKVIPFAGLINKREGTSALDYTAENFTMCTQTILENIIQYSLAPLYYVMNVILSEFSELSNALDKIRTFANKMRNSMTDMISVVMGKLLNVTIPLVQLGITMKDLLGKTSGTLAASLFTFLGGFITMQSWFALMIKLIINVLLILAAIIVTALLLSFVLSAIPFVGSALAMPVTIIAVLNTIIMIAILIPTIIIQVFMQNVLDLSSPLAPMIPGCFCKNTILTLKNKTKKYIYELEIGDELVDGSIITGLFKMSAFEQEMYKINNITITGNHRVYHSELGLIPTEKHPKSTYIDDYREPFVYCINTNTKRIKLGKLIFSDWDDLDEIELLEVQLHCINNEITPNNFNKNNIHVYLDNGFHEDMLVELDDGRSVSIKDVEVNDVLRFGERVVGIVKIDALNLAGVYEYYLEDNIILKCSRNVEFHDKTGKLLNTNNVIGNKIINTKYLYNVLTDRETFIINGVKVLDYNSGIEKYLSEPDVSKYYDHL